MTPYEHLMLGLISEHAELYETNAFFKNGVDNIASLIPILVDGLADKSDIAYQRMLEDIKLLEREETTRSTSVREWAKQQNIPLESLETDNVDLPNYTPDYDAAEQEISDWISDLNGRWRHETLDVVARKVVDAARRDKNR